MKEIDFNEYAIKLSKGSHKKPQQGLCVMECVAYIQGEKHTDAPVCACPVIANYCIGINDKFDQTVRDKLLTYVLRIAGSKSTLEIEQKRAFMCADYAVRKFAGIAAPPIVDKASALVGYYAAADAASYAADAATADASDASRHGKIFNLLEDMLTLSKPIKHTEIIETKLRELEKI